MPTEGENTAQLMFTVGTAGGGYVYIYVNGVLYADNVNQKLIREDSYSNSTIKNVLSSHVAEDKKQDIDPGILINITIPLTTIYAHDSNRDVLTLDILSVSMGVKHYEVYYDSYNAGIVSDVTLNGYVVKDFKHTVGLMGETQQLWNNSKAWLSELNKQCGSELCWYKTEFITPTDIIASLAASTHRHTPLLSVALDLGSSFGKGSVWLNGNMLGRVWDAEAMADGCMTCNSLTYTGPYLPEQCRSGCGEPSQSVYKVPLEWFKHR
jgi:hypothetical protein